MHTKLFFYQARNNFVIEFVGKKLYFMLLLTDIYFILLFIVVITRMNALTNQGFITVVNDSRPKFSKFLYLFDRRTILFPVNSTFRKYLNLVHLSSSTKLFRKRRQSNNDFRSESIKYFTCALVSRIFCWFITNQFRTVIT